MTQSAAPTLLIMAAGLGSRYGGLKQLDAVGPAGETIIDYSIYDAIRAGFARVVFVIRKEIERSFRETVGAHYSSRIAVDYVFQDPGPRRTKPWGTAHAVLVAAEAIQEPFAVINADDFYGAHSFQLLARHFNSGTPECAMVAFPLRNTLSPNGTVSRGLCEVDQSGYLQTIRELTRIAADGNQAINVDPENRVMQLTGDELVSMNVWGFHPDIFPALRGYFERFLADHADSSSAEAFLPSFVDEQIASGAARVRVLRTSDPWFGITYRDDLARVAASIRELIAAGQYPESLG